MVKKVKTIPDVATSNKGAPKRYLPMLDRIQANPGQPFELVRYQTDSAGAMRRNLLIQMEEAGYKMEDWKVVTRSGYDEDGYRYSVLYAQYK